MQIDPYLCFNGNCAEAFHFYEQLLGAKIIFTMTYRETPCASQTPPEWQDKIIHTRLAIDGQTLMGCDSYADRYEEPKGAWVSIGVDSAADAERIFAGLSDRGTVIMPIAETFWAIRFGMVIDRFRIPWMINCEKKP